MSSCVLLFCVHVPIHFILHLHHFVHARFHSWVHAHHFHHVSALSKTPMLCGLPIFYFYHIHTCQIHFCSGRYSHRSISSRAGHTEISEMIISVCCICNGLHFKIFNLVVILNKQLF